MKHTIAVLSLLLASCGSGELSTNSETENENNANNGSENNVSANNENNTSSNNANNANNLNNENNVVMDMGTDDGTATDLGSDMSEDIAVDSDPRFHPMFIAVADFFLEKCVNCHAQGQNGNFAMPQVDGTYEEVRVAIDGVASTRGNLIIEPNDPANSQAFIMMTNDAGEQFDAATIAVVEDWINAGAPYFEN